MRRGLLAEIRVGDGSQYKAQPHAFLRLRGAGLATRKMARLTLDV